MPTKIPMKEERNDMKIYFFEKQDYCHYTSSVP